MSDTPPPIPKNKKGLPPIAWVGIGCGGLLLIFAIAVTLLIGKGVKMAKDLADDFKNNPGRALVETVVKYHPDIDIISQDDLKGEATIKVKSTGEEITFTYDDLANGKISFETSDGTFSLDASDAQNSGIQLNTPDGSGQLGGSHSLPDWLKFPDDVEADKSIASWEDSKKQSGSVGFNAALSPKELKQKFGELYPSAKISATHFNPNTEGTKEELSSIKIEIEEPKTVINVTITKTDTDGSQGLLNYSRAK